MKLKRVMAFVLSLAMVVTSSSFGALSVYAAEDELLVVEDSSSDVLLDDSTTIEDKSDEPLEDNSTVLRDNEPSELEDNSNVLYDDSSKDDTLQVEEDSIVSENEAVKDEKASERTREGKLKAEVDPLQIVKVGDFFYAVDTQFAAVASWEPEDATATEAVIPGEIDLQGTTYESPLLEDDLKRVVIGIGASAFEEGEEHQLRSVKMADTVKIIAPEAFADCTLLTSIELPRVMKNTATDVFGVGCIDDYAFKGCTSLAEVKLPDELDAVGAGIFAGCESLTSIEIPAGWEATVVHEKDKDKPYSIAENTDIKEGPFSGSALANIKFASNTKKIADCLLANCDTIESITIPDGVNTIGKKTFYSCDNLKRFEIGNASALKVVDDWAFQKCVSLKRADFPKYTATLGTGAFLDCSALTATTVPFSINKIGDRAYLKCVELESVVFGEGVEQNVTGGTIGKYAFGDNTYNPNSGYKYPLSKITHVTIPNSMTTIDNSAFEGCTGLVSLEFEDMCTFAGSMSQSINTKAFFNCTSLASVTFSGHLETVGESAFENCTPINSLTFPDSVKTIGKSAFKNVASLATLTLSRNLETISEQSFRACGELKQVEIPMSITKVDTSVSDVQVDGKDKEKGTFYECNKLTDVKFVRFNDTDGREIPDKILLGAEWAQNITMPNDTTVIGSFAFAFCSALRKVNIPASVVEIEGGAFGACILLGARINKDTPNPVIIPEGVTAIGRSAFKYCTSLEVVNLPKSLETLGKGKGDGAFEYCTALQSIVIPDNVVEIGEATFARCQNLETATLPAGITKIDNQLFMGDMKLAEVKNVNKDTLTEIGNSAFEDCDKLTSFDNSGAINFADYNKLTKIGNRAFADSDGITTVILSAATENLGTAVFENCDKLENVTIGTGPKAIPENAFKDVGALTKVTIPRNVKVIKRGAFENDANLAEVHIPKETEIEAGAFSYSNTLTLYVVKDSPAYVYATENHINYVEEFIYATSIDFTDTTTVMLKVKDKQDVPGVNVKPTNYSVDVEYTSSNTNVFTVEEYTDTKTKETKHRIVAVGVGTAELKAQVPIDADGNKATASVNVTVKKPVTSVTMAKGMQRDNTINIPDTIQLEVVVNPDDATDKRIKWASEDESICVVDTKGIVHPKNPGTTRVAAISLDDENKQCVFNITVTNNHSKKADPSWAKGIKAPRIVGESSKSIKSRYGAEIELVSDTPGAQVYFTVDGSDPVADYEGNMDGVTQHYTSPIVLNEETFGATAIALGVLHLNAISIREGFQYSSVEKFTINLSEGDEWGDIDDAVKTQYFNGDFSKVPVDKIWFIFEGDKTVYEKGAVTQVVKFLEGTKVTFNEGIRVFYGTSQLYEGRDYGTKYANNTSAGSPTLGNPPTVTIKGKGGTYKGSEEFKFEIKANPTPGSKVTVVNLNKDPVYTGSPLTEYDLGQDGLNPVGLVNEHGEQLVEGTDYDVVASTLRASGKFCVEFKLKGDKYTGTKTSEQINVMPYNMSKDKEGAKKITVYLDGRTGSVTVPYCKTGAKPAVKVVFNGQELKEGLDYTVKYKNNKKVSKGNVKASAVIRGKGNFKGKYVQEFIVGSQDLANVSLVAEDKYVKEGGSLKVLPILMDDGRILSKSKDYNKFGISDCTYTYASGTNEGQEVKDGDPLPANGTLIRVSVDITTKSTGPYKVTQKTMAAYYKILTDTKNNLKKAKVTVNPDKVFYYNESKSVQITKDDITVTLNGEVVDKANYEIVSIKNNRLIGTASAEIRGVGNYGGTRRFSFKVRARKL